MTIKQLKAMPDGSRTGGFMLNVKTFKGKYQIKKKWVHKVMLVDETGEMLADVLIGGYNPLMCPTIWIITCTVRTTDVNNKPAKTLYIDQFKIEHVTADEYEAEKEGKVECPFCHKKFKPIERERKCN